jgi:hypothetical protein
MAGMWSERSRITRHVAAMGVVALALASSISCGRLNSETGNSPSYLYIQSLTATSGADPTTYSNTLASDVLTYVKTTVGGTEVRVPTVFEDGGRVALTLALKDVSSTTSPTSSNAITVTRYHVSFARSDGRNTQGTDVPYAFDGATTGTIAEGGATLSFIVVRAQAKMEAPLKALTGGGGDVMISTIATVTFYGADQNGNAVSVTGQMSINFADWGDPS